MTSQARDQAAWTPDLLRAQCQHVCGHSPTWMLSLLSLLSLSSLLSLCVYMYVCLSLCLYICTKIIFHVWLDPNMTLITIAKYLQYVLYGLWYHQLKSPKLTTRGAGFLGHYNL